MICVLYKVPRESGYLAMKALVDEGTTVHPFRVMGDDGYQTLVVYHNDNEREVELEIMRMRVLKCLGKSIPFSDYTQLTRFSTVRVPPFQRAEHDIYVTAQIDDVVNEIWSKFPEIIQINKLEGQNVLRAIVHLKIYNDRIKLITDTLLAIKEVNRVTVGFVFP